MPETGKSTQKQALIPQSPEQRRIYGEIHRFLHSYLILNDEGGVPDIEHMAITIWRITRK